MSSSDIFDVLNIKHKSSSPRDGTPSAATSAAATSKPQFTGIQRELYNLLGENQPPIAIQPTNRFKEKLTGKPSPWTLKEFWSVKSDEDSDSSMRKGVKLYHWVKGSKELLGYQPQESTFNKFNQHLTLPEFTKEEYENFMRLARERLKEKVNPKSNEETKKKPKKAENSTGNNTVTETKDNEEIDSGTSEKDAETETVNGDGKEKTMAVEDETAKKNAAKDETDNKNTEELKEASEEAKEKENKEEEEDDWSFEEVDYLFKLCKKYDLRWFIISDRYDFKTDNTGDVNQRTLEDMKDKFYEVSKKYFAARNPTDPLLESLNYHKSRESERKKYLERLLSRSAAEIAEEEALIIESKKFEMAAKKTLNERESLLRLLDSPNSHNNIDQYMTSQGMSQLYNNLLSDKTKKRKNDSSVPENPWMKQQQQFAQQKQQFQQMHEKRHSEVLTNHNNDTSNTNNEVNLNNHANNNNRNNNTNTNVHVSGSVSPRKTKRQKQDLQSVLKRKTEVQFAEDLLKDFNMDQRKSLGVIAHGEKLSPGVYLRSTKISTFKPALQNKVISTLQELSIPMRPAMPSRDVIQKEEELLKRIVVLLELKKQLDRLEAEKSITK